MDVETELVALDTTISVPSSTSGFTLVTKTWMRLTVSVAEAEVTFRISSFRMTWPIPARSTRWLIPGFSYDTPAT